MTDEPQISDQQSLRFEPLTAVSYSRVSTDRQVGSGSTDDGFSLTAQRAANKRHALSLGAVVVAEFVERGASARTTNRLELQRMLEYVSTRKVDLVVVHKLDRLARNRADDVQIVEALRGAGVRLVSTTENIDETASGRLVHGIMASIAEFYSHNLSTEVKKGLRQKVDEGGTAGRAPLGYGDQDRAPHISWAFEQYARRTWSVPRLTEALSSRGLSSRSSERVTGAPLGLSAVRRMLRNPYYKGVVTLNGVEHRGSHQPLVSAELWEKVQTVLVARRYSERSRVHNHFLQGMLYCYSCDRRLILQHVTSASGKRYTYFACSGRQASPINCHQRAIPITEAEHRVEQLYAYLSITTTERQQIENEEIEHRRTTDTDHLTQLGEIDDHLRDLDERQLKLLDAYYAGALPRTLFLDQQRWLTGRRTQAAHTRDRLKMSSDESRRELAQHLDVLEGCVRLYTGGNPVRKRDLNGTLFQKIRMGREIHETEGIFAEEFRELVGRPKGNLMCAIPTSGKSLVRAIFLFAGDDTTCPWRDSNPQPFP
ncbi:recombinase family protein [Glaciibacter superstes]|uniref:recombinase family protein n=1 Tax=Glaciibacter superstes TaxID=501023 RepID=UPI0003B5012F|nr:recombinase family protein [Glaciibacter superstes]